MAAIADKYNGLFKTEVGEGRFTALANLCLFADGAEKGGDG